MTVATALADVSHLRHHGLDRAALLRHRALDRRHRLHRVVERRNHLAGFEDRFPRRRYAQVSTDRDPDRHARLCPHPRSDPDEVESSPAPFTFRSPATRISLPIPSFHAKPADYLKDSNGQPKRERLSGAQAGADPNEYFVYHKTNTENGPVGRYLVNNDGVPVYLADPGINGVYEKRPDGSSVQKFTAPKATLISYIIKGILGARPSVGPRLVRRFHRHRA